MWGGSGRMNRGLQEAFVNSQLYRLYDGSTLIGQLRQGLDNQWYPELPPSRLRQDAKRDLLRAADALRRCGLRMCCAKHDAT